MRLTLEQAIHRLKDDVVAIPTETVYGLAASLYCPEAIEKIFTLKGRPRQNPLIIHLADPSEIPSWTTSLFPDYEKLSSLWPGPLTLVLQANCEKIPEIVRAGLPTAAFRVPALPLAQSLLKKTGPLVIPSANLSGRPSSTHPSHVEADFGLDFPVLEGGPSEKGVESTILGFREDRWRILRQGALSPEFFLPILNYLPEIARLTNDLPECPGQLFRHYAPKAKLVFSPPAVAVLGFKERSYSLPLISLGSLHNPYEVAHHLYQALRSLDEQNLTTVLLDLDFPHTGLWQTIRERLLKASSNK